MHPKEATINTTTPFSDFGLNPVLLKALDTAGWLNASPIQELTIEPILEGKDIFAQAETGSGKTGSFAIPMIELFLKDSSPAAEANSPIWLV
ncbi:MAG: DEAD/DEAH box helicase, partial [Cyanobacteria bacterium]|nr:DEAD/DEAH box helicase [Cyanobacteria bacterium CG_2015-09_32_10]